MTDHDETDEDRTGGGEADGSPVAPRRAPLIEVLEQAETAGEALKLLAEAYPGMPPTDVLAVLEDHAAALRRKGAEMTGDAASVERLSLVLEELMRRLGAGGIDQGEP